MAQDTSGNGGNRTTRRRNFRYALKGKTEGYWRKETRTNLGEERVPAVLVVRRAEPTIFSDFFLLVLISPFLGSGRKGIGAFALESFSSERTSPSR